MAGRRRVLGPANGSAAARLLVVATAPGRRGAERTGIPLSGDASGNFFDLLLLRAGLEREQIFVSNAVLCNPQDGAGRNAEPTRAEIARCSVHLSAVLDAVDAPLVVAMGRTAFAALRGLTAIDSVSRQLRFEDCLGVARAWTSASSAGSTRTLIATYHPSPLVSNVLVRREALLRQWDAATAALDQLGPIRPTPRQGASVLAATLAESRHRDCCPAD